MQLLKFIISYWKLYIFVTFIIFIILFIFCVIISFYTYKWLNINIERFSIFFNDYHSMHKECLKKYGDYKIQRIFIIKEPCSKFCITMINLVTLYNFKKEIENFQKIENSTFYPQHTSLVCEIKIKNSIRKYVLIEKTNCIRITTDFNFNETQNIYTVKPKQRITVDELLKNTENRIGTKKFFNWHIYENHCQVLTKELLITLNLLNNKTTKFICQEEFRNKLKFTDFTLYMINCIINLYNLLETQKENFINIFK